MGQALDRDRPEGDDVAPYHILAPQQQVTVTVTELRTNTGNIGNIGKVKSIIEVKSSSIEHPRALQKFRSVGRERSTEPEIVKLGYGRVTVVPVVDVELIISE